MRNFIKQIYESLLNRKLQFDILTIFMFLLASTSFFIISFTHSRTYTSILTLSDTVIDKSAEIVYLKIDNFIKEFEKIPQNADSIILKPQDVSPANQTLIAFMQEQVKLYPNLYAFYLGTLDGSLLEITNLTISHQQYFLSK
jgi:hypothetical protein